MTIRNDATRQTIRPHDLRTVRAVVPRQGQALLDADLDQQARHTLTRIEAETVDTLGSARRPPRGAGQLDGVQDHRRRHPGACGIGAGRGYLKGWLLENPTNVTLATQPHPRSDTQAAPYAMVLKSLVRHVDPVEETALRRPGARRRPGRRPGAARLAGLPLGAHGRLDHAHLRGHHQPRRLGQARSPPRPAHSRSCRTPPRQPPTPAASRPPAATPATRTSATASRSTAAARAPASRRSTARATTWPG